MPSAIEQWKHRVEAHHEQSLRAQRESSWSAADFWRPLTAHFRSDPNRSDDPVLERLAREVDSGRTLLDVGAGAGRYALPLALRARHVTVVEPSESMVDELRKGAQETGVTTLSVVQGLWEEVDVEPADLVLCAHVVYGTADIEPFVRKLASHARERVLMLAFTASPLAHVAPFWQAVHGEERVDLPALPELVSVLWEMDIYPDVAMFNATRPEAIAGREVALQLLRYFLFVQPDTEKDRRLRAAMEELLVETSAGVTVRGSRPRREALIAWRPG